VTSLEEGIVVVGSDGRIESVNPAAARIMGINDVDDIDDHFTCAAAFLLCEPDDQALECGWRELCTVLRSREPQTGHILSFEHAGGQRRWLSANSGLLNPEDTDGSAVLISFTDITAQHNRRQQLAHDAAHDALTGLPNRAQTVALIDAHGSSTGTDTLGAVLFIDLDSFKSINDTYGHRAGDYVLQAAAKQLRTAVRSSDVVGRFGGDEFVVLILGQVTREEVGDIAERIGTTVRASVGIVMLDDDDDPRDAGQIVGDADTAMYQAKAAGGGTSRYFAKALPEQPASTQPAEPQRDSNSRNLSARRRSRPSMP
jgi:diguanylate cyclase (GGDEF)-like protein/PAS domain S-box-containing protein